MTNNPPQWDPDPGLAGFDYYIQSTGSPQTIDLHTTDEESDNGNQYQHVGLPADISLYATITPTDPKAGDIYDRSDRCPSRGTDRGVGGFFRRHADDYQEDYLPFSEYASAGRRRLYCRILLPQRGSFPGGLAPAVF